MRRIVIVAGQWLDDLGGGKKVVSSIIRELARNEDFQLVLVDFESRRRSLGAADGERIDLPGNVEYRPIFSPWFKQNPWMFLRFLRILRSVAPDEVMDVTGPKLKTWNVLLAKLFLPRSLRYVLFDHSPVAPLLDSSRLSQLYGIFTPIAYRRADLVGSVSEELSQSTLRSFDLPSERVFHISNPIDVEEIREKSRESNPAERYGAYVVSVGRLDPFQKDFPLLIRAFASANISPEVKLLIVGDGPQRGELAELIGNLGMEERIILTGYQPNPYPFYANALSLVLSTKFESFGMVIVEALACGAPVISSDCDFGPREILGGGEFGILVPVGSESALREAIERLCNGPKLRKDLSRRGHDRAMRYDSRGIIEEYTELLHGNDAATS
jgi:glycosyltransferase involved in cell wall biosynthesis